MKNHTTIFLSAVIAAVTITNAFALDPDQSQRWKKDIEHYRTTLAKQHINLYHTVSEEAFNLELNGLIKKLPEISEPELIFEMMRITRLINDGHTQFPIMSGPHNHYPLRFRLIGADVYVAASSDAYLPYLGARVVAVDEKPIAQVLDILSPVVQPAENEFSLLSSLAFHLTVDNMLIAAGIATEPGKATFTFKKINGEIISERIASVPMYEFVNKTNHHVEAKHRFNEREVVQSNGLWLTSDDKTKTAYISFSSYPSFEEMLEFSQRVEEYLRAKKIENLIIDMRENSGGDFYTGLVLSSAILSIDQIDWNNGVYVLIGRNTFSAGMTNAVQFRQILNAKLIGEPTGANPTGYQELGMFELPNSKRKVFYSKRLFRFENPNSDGVQPDVFVDIDVESFRSNEDPVIDWVISDIEHRRTPQ